MWGWPRERCYIPIIVRGGCSGDGSLGQSTLRLIKCINIWIM